ncbi:hypothetical protein SynBIOSE41_01060 [Synechococcus sp. BIOS-E4-1]|nr:hypothetical protein SynBIOSE41_01060 [Synechococcus sp. BIOS-E4-1]
MPLRELLSTAFQYRFSIPRLPTMLALRSQSMQIGLNDSVQT